MNGPGRCSTRETDRCLDPARPYKPLDVGNGIVAGTVSRTGRLLSLGITHPLHGRIILTDAPPFPEDRRDDPAVVRTYRAALADPARSGAGFAFSDEATEAFLRDDRIPVVRGTTAAAAWEITTFAPAGRHGVVQLARGTGGVPDGTWTGALRLGRAVLRRASRDERHRADGDGNASGTDDGHHA